MAKTWLITGCSEGGIGEGIARAVLEKGDNAIVTARTTAKVEGIVADYPETALAVALDLTQQDSIDAAYDAAIAKFGQVDVLVNNAGYCYRSSVEEADPAGVQAMFDANFFGMVAMIKSAATAPSSTSAPSAPCAPVPPLATTPPPRPLSSS